MRRVMRKVTKASVVSVWHSKLRRCALECGHIEYQSMTNDKPPTKIKCSECSRQPPPGGEGGGK